jgi:5,6-dimethylbenzimidazole synthase
MPNDFTVEDRENLHRLLRLRRDIREFRPDPIPEDALRRILEAAHFGPSVGYMQPWNFIVIRSLAMREAVKASFVRTTTDHAAQIDEQDRQRLYASLKLEGILESPLNLAITCDRRRGGAFVLGRGSMPDTDLYSTCCAIQNLWLAARVEGVGVGWVSIIEPTTVEQLLGLPDGVRLVAYLCVGYPVSFGSRPQLEEKGWRDRLPLDALIFAERWGGTETPMPSGEPVCPSTAIR